jgi:capsular exopolysaccharide synthesis family protein
MSRIQNILEKAEREGAIRTASPVAAPPVLAPLPPPSAVVTPLKASSAIPIEELQPPSTSPRRVIANARLDRRLMSVAAADSAAAEQYRALRTRMLHADNGSAVNVVLVTSPGRAEGKTLTAANLALTMAQDYQRRICLVDADLRNPQLNFLFGLPDGPGLSDVLSGQASLEDALVTIDDEQITVLPAGSAHGRPAELLGTTSMRRVIETLRTQFDRVVVDAPATAPLADVGILVPLVDSVLLVVRSGITTRPAIHDAIASIDGSKLLGVVLNEVA